MGGYNRSAHFNTFSETTMMAKYLKFLNKAIRSVKKEINNYIAVNLPNQFIADAADIDDLYVGIGL